MNTNDLLQQALDELAIAAAKLNESAIRLRCAFSDEDRKGEQKAGCTSFGAHSLDMQFAASSGIGNPKRDFYNGCQQAAQSAQVARADLGKEWKVLVAHQLRDVSDYEVAEAQIKWEELLKYGQFSFDEMFRAVLNNFIAGRRLP